MRQQLNSREGQGIRRQRSSIKRRLSAGLLAAVVVIYFIYILFGASHFLSGLF
jgi:hypothetical protein